MRKYIPLRQFIFDRLYHPTHGYFCKKDFQVGELSSPINFKKLIGYDDYQKQLSIKYPQNAWLTPCEIFKPYYGMTIASYLKRAHEEYQIKNRIKKSQKIRIVEAGAGTGSAAESIIYFFKNFEQELLPLVEYNIVEISPTLCKRIQQKLQKSYPQLLKNKQIKIINDDITNFSSNQLTYMLFFEVLDNLPHDKVIWEESSGKYEKYVGVDVQQCTEQLLNIQDEALIRECLRLYQQNGFHQVVGQTSFIDKIAQFFVKKMLRKGKQTKDLFLPTFLFQMMKKLSKNVPNAHFVISDFDSLISSIQGINAPIVSTKGFKSQEKQDFDTYLVERGKADIFFPVDFYFLKTLHQECTGKSARVLKSHEFVSEFSYEEWAQTKSGFNPVKEDFLNTSFLVTEIEE